VKAVLFDLDGTLLDSSQAVRASFNQALREAGLPEASEREFLAGFGRDAETWLAEVRPDGDARKMAKRANALFAREFLPTLAKPYPGAVACLEALHGKFKLGVVTNQALEEFDSARAVLGFNGFDAIVTRSQVARPKPDPEMLLKALDRFHVSPAQAAFVGDSATDAAAGDAAGVRTLLVERAWNKNIDVEKTTLEKLPSLFIRKRA